MENLECNSCDAIMIQGVFCHETGCPDSWKGKEKECKWCGGKFMPEEKYQKFCCEDCADNYTN